MVTRHLVYPKTSRGPKKLAFDNDFLQKKTTFSMIL